MIEQRNLILAITLSIAILLGFQFLYEIPRQEQQQKVQQAQQLQQAQQAQQTPSVPSTAQPGATQPGAAAPGAPGAVAPAPAAPGTLTREAALAQSPRIKLQSPRLSGSIALQGARLDDVVLNDYRVTVQPGSPNILLLSPLGTAEPYFAEYGWVSADTGIALPGRDTLWRASRDTLTPEAPVTLAWDNGQGLRFERVLALDANFMITVTDRVINNSGRPVSLLPYGLISRTGTPPTLGFYILHEGLIGWIGGALKEWTYKDTAEKKKIEQKTKGGWLGITDKYWLVALIPDQAKEVLTRFTHSLPDRLDRYQADFTGDPVAVPAGSSTESTSHLFVGAKEVKRIEAYGDNLKIERFDLVVDWGWFPFLTKPIFYMLDQFAHWLGNFGLAILALTVVIKLVLFPLANKSYRAMSKLKLLQPEMMKLRERFGEDRVRLNQEMMALYKREKANPAAGCLPILVQIPVFFALYKVLFVTIEMRHAPFYGWIKDLSDQDPTTIFNLFGLIPWDPTIIPVIGPFLHLGAWPLIMGVTMWFQQKMNPQPPDPIQAKLFMLMPIMFTFLLANFSAGLVIYWAWNNVLSMAQQWWIMRLAEKESAKSAAKAGSTAKAGKS
ncbi:MAG: membrane protein insertase YidC [Alphaproteobacteria bacterium]|nr:membrane protein insertase YidC [Alphaproteobacteria bacterium]